MAIDPKPGLVIRYDFLWKEEERAGQVEGIGERGAVHRPGADAFRGELVFGLQVLAQEEDAEHERPGLRLQVVLPPEPPEPGEAGGERQQRVPGQFHGGRVPGAAPPSKRLLPRGWG